MTIKHLHLPLPEAIYRRLRAEANHTGRPATQLAREAIDRWLAEARRKAIQEAIAEYAIEVAGGPMDLDPELEAAAVDHLLDTEAAPQPTRKRRKK